ncbi:MAG: fused MFS/spermidine synthase [Candidatus Omnitrophota bacterium]
MTIFLFFTIGLVGLSGIIAQVFILRELLVSFYGNELILGIILGNWLLAEGLGVFLIGRIVYKFRNPQAVFIILNLLFSLFLPASIYLSRTFKFYFGLPFGETISLAIVFWSSLLVIFPLAFIHGGLFGLSPKIISAYTKRDSSVILGKVYAWETIGTVSGGIILTYLLIPYLNSFQAVLLVSIINIFVCIVLVRSLSNTRLRYLLVFILLIGASLFFFISPSYLQNNSLKKQWSIGKVLDYRNSVYGNIVVLERQGQITFFYNGIPIITTPFADIAFSEEFANLPLLFNKSPKDILVIGGGAGGVINEILKHGVRKIDYVELDPVLIDMLNKYPSDLTRKELGDSRVEVINQDSSFFLKNSKNKYDVILIGFSQPLDLSINRHLSYEFFKLCRKHLNSGGILGFSLPGSLTYLSRELRDLNYSILNAANKSYSYVRIIPGDYNIYLASDSADILKVDSQVISNKLSQQNIFTNLLLPRYLDYRLDPVWVKWFKDSSVGATFRINRDLAPIAVFEMLIFWNKQFSSRGAYVLGLFDGLRIEHLLLLIILISIILFYLLKARGDGCLKSAVVYSIATTGFSSMLISLVLIFSFQINYGFVYHALGLLISVFMAGIAAGSLLITAGLKKIKDSFKPFWGLEAAIILFSLFLAWFMAQEIIRDSRYNYWIYLSLFLLSGLLCGMEFPLAAKLYLKGDGNIGKATGALYFADLAGSWLAGILTGVIFLPILGLFNTCMIVVILKLSSLVLLISFKKISLTNKLN